MNIIQAVIMGIVQGLSEFLPISSSAHLVFTSNFYKIFKGLNITEASSQEVFFDIMLHLGTLIAVLIFFRKDIMDILKAFYKAVKTSNYDDDKTKLGLYIILGTLVTIFVVYPLNNIAEKLVFAPMIVGMLLVGTGIFLFVSEKYSQKIEKTDNLDLKTALLMAFSQGLAALPGFSRSGLTIATGLFRKLDRTTAARFSFLLSIPIILGASMLYPLIKLDFSEVIGYDWCEIIVGTVVSGVVGYLCIKYFLKFVAKFSLNIFAIYCILVGAFTSIFFAIVK